MYVRYYSNDTTAKGSGYGVFIEWICHNMGYRYPSIASLLNSDMTRNSALDSCRDVDLNKGDNKSKYYRLLGGLCEFFY